MQKTASLHSVTKLYAEGGCFIKLFSFPEIALSAKLVQALV